MERRREDREEREKRREIIEGKEKKKRRADREVTRLSYLLLRRFHLCDFRVRSRESCVFLA
jgi:hypothetical protein